MDASSTSARRTTGMSTSPMLDRPYRCCGGRRSRARHGLDRGVSVNTEERPPPSRVGSCSQPVRKRDLLRRHERTADLELDLRVRKEWNLAWVAGEDASVEERGNTPVDGTDFLTIEGLAPDVEELAERVGPVDRRLGVDDSVGGMRVQPHEARGSGDKRTARSRLHSIGRPDADRSRHLSRNTPDEDRQGRVDVKEHLLACLACDAVDLLAGRR